MPTIRSATQDDVAAIQAIELDAGHRFREVGMTTIADAPVPTASELASPIDENQAWVATESDASTPVGFALASIVDGHAHLAQVSVTQAAGGQGIGRALISAVAQWGRDAGFDQLSLTTFREVAFNGPVYLRLGFVELSTRDCGPELTAIREAEVAMGLDNEGPRMAMIRSLRHEVHPQM